MKSSQHLKQNYACTITVGLEYEPSSLSKISNNLREDYQQQLKLSKKAKVIKDLVIEHYFLEESEFKSHLCLVKIRNAQSQECENFMEVVFDDNNSMSQLEFISTGKGILTYDKFFTQQNLDAIKSVTENFQKAVYDLKNSESIENNILIPGTNDNIVFEFPKHAVAIFKCAEITKKIGQVHVTHTCPMKITKIKESKFIESTKDSGGTRKSFFEDISSKGLLNTGDRTRNSPNTKLPLEILKGQSEYIKAIKKGEALYPMSNIYEYVLDDIALYKNIIQLIESKPSDQFLSQAKTKLNNTVVYLEHQISLKQNIIKQKGNQAGNVLIFESYEEKFLPPVGQYFLVEHRNGKIQKPLYDYITGKKQKYPAEEFRNIKHIFEIIDVVQEPKFKTFSQVKKDEEFTQQSKDEAYKQEGKLEEEVITFNKKDINQELIAASAAGDDRNLIEHGSNPHYWYSIADGMRLLSWLRQHCITYTNEANQNEEYIAHRENNNRIFITDPYYADNFSQYLSDDTARITEGKIEEVVFVDKKWTSMPTTIIIPLLSGLHWRTVKIAINYDEQKVQILFDDPYGNDKFPDILKQKIFEAVQTNIQLLIRQQLNNIAFVLKDEDITSSEKDIDQQGIDLNGWDCGPITFSNIGDYVKHLVNQTNLIYSIPIHTDQSHPGLIIQTRTDDIQHYAEIAEIPIDQIRLDNIKKELQHSREERGKNLLQLTQETDIDIEQLETLYIDMLFDVLNNSRLLGLNEETGEYTKKEMQEAYNIVLYERKQQQKSTLKGTVEYSEENPIDWIDSYFGKYTLDGLSNILDLRTKDLKLKNVKILKGIFVDQGHNNIEELLSEVIDTKVQIILVPLNLFNKHAAGLIFEKTNDGLIQVKYLDPENKSLPTELVQIFSKYNLHIEQLKVEQQKYANCGVEVIEDFIFYLTGERLSQEEAIPYHSYLVEQNLFYGNYEDSQLVGCEMMESAYH